MSNSGKRQVPFRSTSLNIYYQLDVTIHLLPLLFTAIGLTLLYQVFVFRTLGQFSL